METQGNKDSKVSEIIREAGIETEQIKQDSIVPMVEAFASVLPVVVTGILYIAKISKGIR